MPEPTLPVVGDVIDGKYVLERLLGKGGMGAVFAARHLKLGSEVAIKVMLANASDREAAARFVNEGRAVANIQSDHVVRVVDVDDEGDYAYMVLELLDGEDLGAMLQRVGPLPPHVAVGFVLQALAGLKLAHARGIVHRDLKPSNLFLTKRADGSVVVKVLDFGISKASAASQVLGQSLAQLTSTRAMLGSPFYMSPEQVRSSKSVDARADIWAVGVILHELMTGRLPFDADNLGSLFAAILENDAPPLEAPGIPPALGAVAARCLQRKADQRFGSVEELEVALAPFARPGLVDARGSSPAFAAAPPAAAELRGPYAPVAPPPPLAPAAPLAPAPLVAAAPPAPAWSDVARGPMYAQTTGSTVVPVAPREDGKKSVVPIVLVAVASIALALGVGAYVVRQRALTSVPTAPSSVAHEPSAANATTSASDAERAGSLVGSASSASASPSATSAVEPPRVAPPASALAPVASAPAPVAPGPTAPSAPTGGASRPRPKGDAPAPPGATGNAVASPSASATPTVQQNYR